MRALPLQRGGLQRKRNRVSSTSLEPTKSKPGSPSGLIWTLGDNTCELLPGAEEGTLIVELGMQLLEVTPLLLSQAHRGCTEVGLYSSSKHQNFSVLISKVGKQHPQGTVRSLTQPVANSGYHSPRTQGPGNLGPHTVLLHTPNRHSLTAMPITQGSQPSKGKTVTFGTPGNSSKSKHRVIK